MKRQFRREKKRYKLRSNGCRGNFHFPTFIRPQQAYHSRWQARVSRKCVASSGVWWVLTCVDLKVPASRVYLDPSTTSHEILVDCVCMMKIFRYTNVKSHDKNDFHYGFTRLFQRYLLHAYDVALCHLMRKLSGWREEQRVRVANSNKTMMQRKLFMLFFCCWVINRWLQMDIPSSCSSVLRQIGMNKELLHNSRQESFEKSQRCHLNLFPP